MSKWLHVSLARWHDGFAEAWRTCAAGGRSRRKAQSRAGRLKIWGKMKHPGGQRGWCRVADEVRWEGGGRAFHSWNEVKWRGGLNYVSLGGNLQSVKCRRGVRGWMPARTCTFSHKQWRVCMLVCSIIFKYLIGQGSQDFFATNNTVNDCWAMCREVNYTKLPPIETALCKDAHS